MSKARDRADLIRINGKVVQVLPSTTFLVDLENGKQIKASISGKIRKNHIRIINGDDVVVEISIYNMTDGRIIRRGLDNNAKNNAEKNNADTTINNVVS